MKVKSYTTNNDWLETQDAQENGVETEEHRPDSARQEIDRVLSDILRTKNLTVLTGLGTSLCVKDGDNPKAPTMWALWEAVKNEYETDVEGRAKFTEILEIAKHPDEDTNIEELLSRCKIAEAFYDEDNKGIIQRFIDDAEKIIREKVDFLSPNEQLEFHQAFLRKLGRRSTRRDRLKVFTTNYDRCFEHAARQTSFVVIDGFSLSFPSYFDPLNFKYDIVRRSENPDAPDYIENLFHLYKVHGSIDWEVDKETCRIVKKEDADRPLLIYPRSSKYELAFAQPYLEMISSFQSSIRSRETGLLIIGFGFNDNHIAEPIMAAIETNLSLKVVVIAPDIEEKSAENPHLAKIAGLIERGDARLSMIKASFEDVVPIMPDVTAMTDLERHAERIRSVRE